jgi:hypothetical protein
MQIYSTRHSLADVGAELSLLAAVAVILLVLSWHYVW